MKNLIVYRLITISAIASFPLSAALAADTNAVAPEAVAPQPAAPSAPAKLPYGVEDVLKLSRAQISDDIILNYIHNSGTIYNLSPEDIVNLRNQGVSDRVLNAMLDQRNQVVQAAAQPVPQPATPAPSTVPAVADTGAVQAAPTYVDSSQVYASVPEAQPASSLYVIPYPPRTSAYYGTYWPYSPYSYYGPYGYYGGYYGPVVGFGFTFGGYGGYRGGYWGYHGGPHGGPHGGSHGGPRGGHR